MRADNQDTYSNAAAYRFRSLLVVSAIFLLTLGLVVWLLKREAAFIPPQPNTDGTVNYTLVGGRGNKSGPIKKWVIRLLVDGPSDETQPTLSSLSPQFRQRNSVTVILSP